MRRSVWFAVVCAIAAVLAPHAAWAGQEGDQPAMTPEMMAEMEAWMKLAQPGEHHQHLAPFVGRWKGLVKMWMAPGAEPMENEAEAEAALIMGGRFLEWRNSGSFGGMPFEGRAIEGYNNGSKRYESTWMDSFGTLILFFTGSCSNDGKSREMTTRFDDPVVGGTISYRTEYTWVDADHFIYTAFMDKGDGEFKNMEIRYSRK